MWKRREHSDDPKVVFGGQGKDKVNSNAPDKDNAPDRVNSSAPGGWTERVAVDRALEARSGPQPFPR